MALISRFFYFIYGTKNEAVAMTGKAADVERIKRGIPIWETSGQAEGDRACIYLFSGGLEPRKRAERGK